MADRAAPMSSEATVRERFRQQRCDPEWWFEAYASEYIGDDGEQLAEAREDFDAMIQQIERRLLAQQPCYGCGEMPCVGVDHRMFRCCEQKQPSDRCSPCAARQTQETSG